jgi:hypothetical protein
MSVTAPKRVANDRAKKLDSYVAVSSSVEGISFERAKKNAKVISLLKKYGHAFSV